MIGTHLANGFNCNSHQVEMRRITTKAVIKANANGTSIQAQNQVESKQIRGSDYAKNVISPNDLFTIDIVQSMQSFKLPTKDPLPPIRSDNSRQSDDYEKVDDKRQDVEAVKDNYLPLKLFDGKKQSLDELNAESMQYIWLRRFKEIFLHMNNGEDNNNGIDPFVEFDMNLAKIDMANTCDRYIENERFVLTRQVCKINRIEQYL